MDKSSYTCEKYKLLWMVPHAFLTSSNTTNLTTIKSTLSWLQHEITGNWVDKEAALKYTPYHEKVILNPGYAHEDQNIIWGLTCYVGRRKHPVSCVDIQSRGRKNKKRWDKQTVPKTKLYVDSVSAPISPPYNPFFPRKASFPTSSKL